MRRAIIFIGISFLFLFQTTSFAKEEDQQPDQQVEAFIQELFQARAQILLDADLAPLEKFYTKEKTSVYAKGYELRRAKYIQAWAKLRNIHVESTNNQIRIVKVKKKTDDQASVSVIQTLRVTYRYANENLPLHSFGIGTRHHLLLKRVQNQWYVSREYYSDPMEENPNNIPVTCEKRIYGG